MLSLAKPKNRGGSRLELTPWNDFAQVSPNRGTEHDESFEKIGDRIFRNLTRKYFIVVALALLLSGIYTPSDAAAPPQQMEGSWTGGFWLDSNWVAVNVRFNRENENPTGTADILFPFYGGSGNAINVALGGVKKTANGLHFEVPAGGRKAVFDVRRTGDTITGNYLFEQSQGTFGLTRTSNLTLDTLEKYYGAYRVSPDRVISILRGWNYARTLNYVDYKTGKVGTLWAASETEFFSGDGLEVSFPVALIVSFDRDAAGKVKGLVWNTSNEPQLTAQKIEFREERITFDNGDIKIGATLILPGSKSQYPVIIITPGDYGTNRNQLRLWAHAYVSRGIGALIFDSRGAGESTGAVNSSSFSELANDVLVIVQSLKTREEINSKQIGLFGFSNSAFTVTLAASRSKDISFLILQSLVGVVGWKQESFRAETQLRVDKFPESTVKKGVDFMRLKFEVARTGKGWERLQAIMEQARGERWLAYTNPPNDFERWRRRFESGMIYDPAPALEKLNIPILAYWGDKDTNLPVPETVAVFRRAMAKAGNKNYVVRIYPKASHSLLVSDSGSPSTGGKEKNFVSGLWKMKIDWLLKHLSRPM